MTKDMKEREFQVLAKDCAVGKCPTILESGNVDDLVIVGRLDANVLNNIDVQKHTGDGEIAVVIPKKLLIQAAKALS